MYTLISFDENCLLMSRVGRVSHPERRVILVYPCSPCPRRWQCRCHSHFLTRSPSPWMYLGCPTFAAGGGSRSAQYARLHVRAAIVLCAHQRTACSRGRLQTDFLLPRSGLTLNTDGRWRPNHFPHIPPIQRFGTYSAFGCRRGYTFRECM